MGEGGWVPARRAHYGLEGERGADQQPSNEAHVAAHLRAASRLLGYNGAHARHWRSSRRWPCSGDEVAG